MSAQTPREVTQYRTPREVTQYRTGRVYREVGAARRWFPRLIDGVLTVVLTVILTIVLVSAFTTPETPALAFVLLVLAYVLSAGILGALYGAGHGIGQRMCGVVSRTDRNGEVIGAWRGVRRYLFVAFSPILVPGILTGPPVERIDNVVVTRR